MTSCCIFRIFIRIGMNIEHLRDLGSLIRARRKQARMSIETLAALVPCSPRLLSEMERGTRNVSIGVVLAVCAMLGIELKASTREGNK